ncbi:MAG: DUF3147 domain-containing protein [Chloroflexi bacterium]|nr:DUF3147 domain-containing protein [Chloroflexota bacterium]
MDLKLLPLYFLLGGSVVALVTYIGGQGRGLLAAFVSLAPSVTIITLLTVNHAGGAAATTDYARGMLKLFPAWFVYMAVVVLLLPRIGLIAALAAGMAAYTALSLLIIRLW